MADSAEDEEFYWVKPQQRALMPLDERFHLPRSLRKMLRRGQYHACFSDDFTTIITACAETHATQTQQLVPREETWINAQIRGGFIDLHRLGFAHAVGVYDRHDNLVGGLYGLALGGAFFGESMFSYRSGASKVALVHLVNRLRAAGYVLLDCQFPSSYLQAFGAYCVDDKEYQRLLHQALQQSTRPL